MKFLMLMILIVSAQVQAGPGAGGGGQACENRIQEIRDNITGWINSGGHKNLSYSDGLTADLYKQKMLNYLGVEKQKDGSILPRTAIDCVHEPVKVNDYDKDCRFENNGLGPKIVCYYESFMDKKTMSDDDQYWLIHHEFAGLAEIEPPQGPHSSYKYSNQITGKLRNEYVRRLPIESEIKLVGKKDCKPTPEIKTKISHVGAEALLAPIMKDLDALDIKIDMNSVSLQFWTTDPDKMRGGYVSMFMSSPTNSSTITLTSYLRFKDQDGIPYVLQGLQEGASFIKTYPLAYDKKGNLLTCQVSLDTGDDPEIVHGANVPYFIVNTNTQMIVWTCANKENPKSSVPCKNGIPGKNTIPGKVLFDF